MPSKHEPDPRFVENLEWQLSGELRRRQRARGKKRLGIRVLKVAGLMLGSVALGAGAMEASQQLQEAWRTELLEARLEVQIELSQQRLETQRQALEQTREEVALGLRDERELEYAEFDIERAIADAEITELQLDEIRQSGREPLGELSSPLVGDRDFVSERIQIQMRIGNLRLEIARKEAERNQTSVDLRLGTGSELDGYDLVVIQTQLELDGLVKRLELRQAYLDANITAVEAELRLLENEVQTRIDWLESERQYFQERMNRARDLMEAGTITEGQAAQAEMQVSENEGRLRLAEVELEIVRRELERRRGEQ